MKSKLFFLAILLAVLCICSIAFAQEPPTHEEITLTTYYPAPYGEYNSLSVGDPTAGYTATNPGGLLVEGNVGIGTTGPSELLHLNPSGSSGVDGIFIQDHTTDDTYGARLMFDNDVGNGALILGTRSAGTDIDAVAIARDTGNVGIGTVRPDRSLDIRTAGGTGVEGIELEHGDEGSVWGLGIMGSANSNPGSFTIEDTYVTKFLIDTNGNVGIGTTEPQSKLEIFGDGSTVGSAAIRFNQPAGDNGFSIGLGTADNKLHIGDSWNPESGTHVTIQQNGNVGIGTTSPGIKFDTREAYDHSYVVPTGGAGLWVDLGELPTGVCGIFTYHQAFSGIDPWLARAIGFIATVSDNWGGVNPELPMSIAYHNNDTGQVIKFRVRATSGGATPSRLEIYRSTSATEEGTFRIYRFGY